MDHVSQELHTVIEQELHTVIEAVPARGAGLWRFTKLNEAGRAAKTVPGSEGSESTAMLAADPKR